MAGAGYKLFNTGDVLTAAQVNTYLNEQTVMVFADSAARTTALSGVLAEGMVSYLQDTDSVEVYNGTAFVSVGGGSSPLTTKGDLYTFSTVDARLGVGANGTVLTADSAETTGLKWAAAAGAKSFSLLNPGGTTLTGASTTVSGLSGYDQFMITVINASASGSTMFFQVQINSTTTGYNLGTGYYNNDSSYSTANWNNGGTDSGGSFTLFQNSTAGSTGSGYLKIEGGNTSGVKIATYFGVADGNTSSYNYWGGGSVVDTNVISSLKFSATSGTAFDGGTVYIWGAV